MFLDLVKMQKQYLSTVWGSVIYILNGRDSDINIWFVLMSRFRDWHSDFELKIIHDNDADIRDATKDNQTHIFSF